MATLSGANRSEQHRSEWRANILKMGDGYKYVIPFANGQTAAMSVKSYATKRGCEKAVERLHSVCGSRWEKFDLPWDHINPETGEFTKLHTRVYIGDVV